jgi:twitching motility protein PilT
MLNEINKTQSKHIVTIEDPIEFIFKSDKSLISQREVGKDTESFQTAMKSLLRQDPDVVLVGELRDRESIETALNIAETGHLVFATLHTNSAPDTVNRILSAFDSSKEREIRNQLSSSLVAVISQMLVHNRAAGQGRRAVFEILVNTPAVANLIREGKTHQIYSVMQTNREIGMKTMEEALREI